MNAAQHTARAKRMWFWAARCWWMGWGAVVAYFAVLADDEHSALFSVGKIAIVSALLCVGFTVAGFICIVLSVLADRKVDQL